MTTLKLKKSESFSEMSMIDFLQLLKCSYKTIAISGVIGLAISLAYLAITPKRYVAVAQIAMAQIGAPSGNAYLNPLGVNIEDPSLLLIRLSQPTSFPTHLIAVCTKDMNSDADLSKFVKFALPKGGSNIIEIKAYGASRHDAVLCANAIFELIRSTQAALVEPYLAGVKDRLADNELRLEKAKQMIAKADKSGSFMSATYLSTRDEIRALLDEVAVFRGMLINNQNRATRLISPIYASDSPALPKKSVTLAFGLFCGLFSGLLFAFTYQMWSKFKKELQK